VVFFALPFAVVGGGIIYAQVADTLWSAFDFHRAAIQSAASTSQTPSRAVETADAPRAAEAPVKRRTIPVPSQNLTRPLQALPQWHRFPQLPDGLRANEPVAMQLILTVAADGLVVDASVERSTGLGWLDQQAIEWVKAHWRYSPALKGTKPVPAVTSALVFFQRERFIDTIQD
jgi:outer membrane biosynthesis protein TonB